ncbi:MAG: hypothetical protein ABSE63_09600, partial [Thermoguttaceae bacterium]
MKRRKILLDLSIGGLKCLFAIAVSLAFISHAQAIDVLSYWCFNNATGTPGNGVPGSFMPGTTENYDAGTLTLSIASEGVWKNDSVINLSNLLGTMGVGTTDTWGTFVGYTNNAQPGYAAGQSLSVCGNAAHYVEFDVKTTDYQPQAISYDTRSSGTGSHEHDWQYSLDSGTTWTNIGNLTWTGTGNLVETLDLSSITALNNQSDVRFRVTYAAVGGTGGTNRIDNWTLTGASASTLTLTWNPSSGANTWDASTNNWLHGSVSSTYAAG